MLVNVNTTFLCYVCLFVLSDYNDFRKLITVDLLEKDIRFISKSSAETKKKNHRYSSILRSCVSSFIAPFAKGLLKYPRKHF